ncbi:hypothetical protein I5677_00085 [Mobilitalea sibirica]|uniref:Uncharacterized protein n=1 Tax=Mobilitalea sibirica TaxID=1462919 RepID=A0A8J7H026_9FIRM|nr:DUF6142 family protein [Mobilitalea sibirica]MBH1939284.1 hypothetical protein [Mobilitalea sibirica]
MLRIIRKKDMIHFSGRRHSKTGVISAIIGFAVVAGFIVVSVISGLMKGEGGLILGVIGFALFALAVFGFTLSYKSFKQRDIFYRFPIIGAVLNGCMTILLLILYILGFGS